jgi:hypothetical protein
VRNSEQESGAGNSGWRFPVAGASGWLPDSPLPCFGMTGMVTRIRTFADLELMIGVLLANGKVFTEDEEILLLEWARLLRKSARRYNSDLLDLRIRFGTTQHMEIEFARLRRNTRRTAFNRLEKRIIRSVNCDIVIAELKEVVDIARAELE